jgi:hypothetical protein
LEERCLSPLEERYTLIGEDRPTGFVFRLVASSAGSLLLVEGFT